MKRITVVGSGFAALTAVRQIRKKNKEINIDLVSPIPRFNYYPSTIWIPTDLRKPEDTVVNLESFFEKKRINYHKSNAIGLKHKGRTLIHTSGELQNDGLIIACGGNYIDSTPGIENTYNACGGPYEAYKVRNKLRNMDSGVIAFGFSGNPNEPSAMRGGPTFEFLLGIESWLRKQKKRNRFELIFFSPAEIPGQRMGLKAANSLLSEMSKRGVKLILGKKIKGFTENQILFDDSQCNADIILFTPGLKGQDWFGSSDAKLSKGGFFCANEFGQAEGLEKTYVAGDCGSYLGPDWLPKQAHMADVQAICASNNLLLELDHSSAKHTYAAELICIVDSYSKGTIIFRNKAFNFMLPLGLVGHFIKKLFEKIYLSKYKK